MLSGDLHRGLLATVHQRVHFLNTALAETPLTNNHGFVIRLQTAA